MAATSTTRGTGRHRDRRPSDDLHASRTETRRYYREVAAADPHRAAFEAGLANGDRPGPEEPDSVHEAFAMGQRQAADKTAKKAAAPNAPKASPAGGGGGVSFSMGEEGAGLLLGLIAFALTVNYLQYGWPGVTGWMSAKFLNKVTLTQAASPAKTTVVAR